MAEKITIALVHGAFADASGFGDVIKELETAGYDVVAMPNPLRGLAADAESIAARAKAIDGPVVLVGHSYGGAVISQAAAGLDNVKALVFVAGFGPDEGENCAGLLQPYSPSLLASNLSPTSYDAPGAAGGPDLYISKEVFHEAFCADVPEDLAQVMYATQRPISAAAFNEKATAAGWKNIPSYFLVTDKDNGIPRECQEFMAERMKATIEHVDGSHVAFIANPKAAVELIRKAAEA